MRPDGRRRYDTAYLEAPEHATLASLQKEHQQAQRVSAAATAELHAAIASLKETLRPEAVKVALPVIDQEIAQLEAVAMVHRLYGNAALFVDQARGDARRLAYFKTLRDALTAAPAAASAAAAD
jgi:hypothetical protein